jgi:hypothetical protein
MFVDRYGERIDNFYLIDDRVQIWDDEHKIFPLLLRLMKIGKLKRYSLACAAPYDDVEDRVLWQQSGLELAVLAPDAFACRERASAGDHNGCSAVCVIRRRERDGSLRNLILFAGDAGVSDWKRRSAVKERTAGGRQRLEVDLLVFPHHGGHIGSAKSFLDSYVISKHAVFSVGTKNQHDHPRAENISVCVERGVKVHCTEITEKCCVRRANSGEHVLRRRLSTLERGLAWDSAPPSAACMGSIKTNILREGIVVERVLEHASAISKIQSRMCALAG